MVRKRAIPIQMVEVLEDGKICLAGRKISVFMPSDQPHKQNLEHAINTFLDYLSHRRGKSFGHFQGF